MPKPTKGPERGAPEVQSARLRQRARRTARRTRTLAPLLRSSSPRARATFRARRRQDLILRALSPSSRPRRPCLAPRRSRSPGRTPQARNCGWKARGNGARFNDRREAEARPPSEMSRAVGLGVRGGLRCRPSALGGPRTSAALERDEPRASTWLMGGASVRSAGLQILSSRVLFLPDAAGRGGAATELDVTTETPVAEPGVVRHGHAVRALAASL